MTDIIMQGCEPRTLLSHLAVYGLAAIVSAQGTAEVRAGWTSGANPRPFVVVPDADAAAGLIARHASAASSAGSWARREHRAERLAARPDEPPSRSFR